VPAAGQGPDRWHAESLFETDLPRLIGAEDQPKFDF
jgi:protein-L-isoaspartate(D-aspartate) O-methyltransferase